MNRRVRNCTSRLFELLKIGFLLVNTVFANKFKNEIDGPIVYFCTCFMKIPHKTGCRPRPPPGPPTLEISRRTKKRSSVLKLKFFIVLYWKLQYSTTKFDLFKTENCEFSVLKTSIFRLKTDFLRRKIEVFKTDPTGAKPGPHRGPTGAQPDPDRTPPEPAET